MAVIHDVTEYAFNQTDHIVVDTNIWLMLHRPHPDPRRTRAQANCTQAFRKIQERNCELLLPQVVLSEFVNVVIDEHFKEARGYSAFASKKAFRQSKPFGACIEEIRDTVTRILDTSTPVTYAFDEDMAHEVLEGLTSADYTDLVLVQIAQEENAILLTDDGDLASHSADLDIITGNSRVLDAG